jgi:hypothetical protein
MSFYDAAAPNPGKEFVSEVKKRCPNIFLIIFRNKNLNVVVYELNTKEGKINSDNPVNVYWLDVDPAYRNVTRAKNISHDRVELNTFDNTFVYGVNSEMINDRECQIRFKADSSTPMRVKLSPNGASLYVVKDNTIFLIRSAYVAATENLNLIRLRDNVSELTFQVMNMKTKTSSEYRVK